MSRISNLLVSTVRPLWQDKSSEQSTPNWLRIVFVWIVKLGVSVAAILYIYFRLQAAQETLSLDSIFINAFSPVNWIAIAGAGILLAVLNWGLEVVKWHLLLRGIYKTPITTSIKAVITGTTFGVFTPNRFGEFIGRILALQPNQRIGASMLSFVNGLAQTVATFSFGIVGFVFLLQMNGTEFLGPMGVFVLQFILILFWITIVSLYFRLNKLMPWLSNQTALGGRVAKHAHALRAVDSKLLNSLFLLSCIRFVTFIFQYFLVFFVLMPEPNWLIIGGASMLSLFSSTVLAFIPMPDLLMRQMIAMSYFELFNYSVLLVGQVVLFVWIVNVAFPALLGAFILFSYRIYRKSR